MILISSVLFVVCSTTSNFLHYFQSNQFLKDLCLAKNKFGEKSGKILGRAVGELLAVTQINRNQHRKTWEDSLSVRKQRK